MTCLYDDLSLSALKQLNPSIAAAIEQSLPPTSYEDWIDNLYKDVDDIVKRHITPNASFRNSDSEDRFNVDFVSYLIERGHDASHDRWENGHPDIHVIKEVPQSVYKWIGETKIHSEYNNLMEGYKQLSSRYSSGLKGENQGAILIINKNKDLLNVMNTWKDFLLTNGASDYANLANSVCPINESSFVSTHTHEKSGLIYKVRHIPISVYFNPIDKSGMKSKATKTKTKPKSN